MGTQLPYVQLQESDEGRLVGLIRAHRATLVSAGAAVTVDQWPIQGKTNGWATPTWKTVIEQALLVLCEPLLDMEAFIASKA